jgi:hypothetical protein
MATEEEINKFLQDFKAKLSIWGIVYRDDRQKNFQTLLALDLTTTKRTEILHALATTDYAGGPLKDNLHGGTDMWVFGKLIKHQEVYIKITMGLAERQVICISFHLAEKPLFYPLK